MEGTNDIYEFYAKMLATADNAGIPVLSDDFCCQLLAWVHSYGGGIEALILNKKLNADIKHAQERLNIYGGEKPNEKLVPVLHKYLLETKGYLEDDFYVIPEWAKNIFLKYELQIPPDKPKPVFKVKRQRHRTNFTKPKKRTRTK